MMAEDPCTKAARLREVRTAIATGDTVSKARFGEDEMAYFKANLDLLDREIVEADRLCAIQEGRTPKRTRYAIRGRMRPY
tara:strand:- start:8317 stop:8556 length:240 start_codon:yes stop_codon:yes gene_type:complete